VADTTYIVLREATGTVLNNDTGGWVVYDDVKAPSSTAAVRIACGEEQDATGRWVAVPARSWKPVTVRTETQTVIRLDTPPTE
jgi:hypothetical protein